MLEGEREVTRLDVDLPSSDEHRLEADPLGSDVSVGGRLGTIAYRADSRQVLLGETVFVAFDDYLILMDVERYSRVHAFGSSLRVAIIISILK